MSIILISVLLGTLLDAEPPSTIPPSEIIERSAAKDEYDIITEYIGEVTAYTSREAETDDTPFIAASGKHVHWGMVATNAHPFGTQLRFPELYGDEVFVVGDRMNKRYQNRFDIWFPEYHQARRFGVQNTKVEIIRPRSDDAQLSMK